MHTPEFTFAQYESNVERGIREFGLTYPIVIDSDREIWKAFANRYWPTKYLLDKDGYLRFGHFGEGGYGECEQVIQELLREIDPAIGLPPLMEPLREEDHAGAVCYRASGELYSATARADRQRGRIQGRSDCRLCVSPGTRRELLLCERALGVDGRVLRSCRRRGAYLAIEIRGVRRKLGHGLPHTPLGRGRHPARRQAAVPQTGDSRHAVPPAPNGGEEESYVVVDSARMYFLVDNHDFGEHELELRCSAGRRRVRLYLHQLRRSRGQRAAGRQRLAET